VADPLQRFALRIGHAGPKARGADMWFV